MLPMKHIVRGGLLCLLGAILLFSSATARSQGSLENALEQFSGAAAQGYMQPVADLVRGQHEFRLLPLCSNVPVGISPFLRHRRDDVNGRRRPKNV